MSDITLLLQAASRGECHASDELLPLVYDELRKLAAARMFPASCGQTLQPTALVHEAWLRLVDAGARNWENRAHFFNAAAEAMRHILIDRARRKSRIKHGGDQAQINLEDLELAAAAPDEKLLLINDALKELEKIHPERANVVVRKFFGGLSNKETAESLGISERSVNRHWECAKAWLFLKMHSDI